MEEKLIKELEGYRQAFKTLGEDICLGTACIIFVQGMASGGNPFAVKILDMYAKDENADYVYTVGVKAK